VFCLLNSRDLHIDIDEAEAAMEALAAEPLELPELATFLGRYLRSL